MSNLPQLDRESLIDHGNRAFQRGWTQEVADEVLISTNELSEGTVFFYWVDYVYRTVNSYLHTTTCTVWCARATSPSRQIMVDQFTY